LIELVFIGLDMKEEEIMASLDPCLLSEKENDSDWTQFVEPIPIFTAY